MDADISFTSEIQSCQTTKYSEARDLQEHVQTYRDSRGLVVPVE